MAKGYPNKGKWSPPNMPDYLNIGVRSRGRYGFNRKAHTNAHKLHVLVYTTPSTLALTAGTKFYSPYSGGIAWVKASVQTAPTSGNVTVDLLADSNSILDSSYCIIYSGDNWSKSKYPSSRGVVGTDQDNPTPLQVQIVAKQDAVGPLVLYVGIEVED